MSKRTDSHTLSHAESIYSGDAYQAGAEGNGRGIPRASLVQVDLGTPTVADVNGLFAEDSTGAGPFPFDLTLDGALVTAGVATFDVPRGVQIVGDGTNSAAITFYGTDQYGVEISEEVTMNDTVIVYGKKAFKTITRVAAAADTTGVLTAGDSDILGLPFRLENIADIVVIDENDNNLYQVTGVTAAAAALTAVSLAAVGGAALTENSFDTTPDAIIADCRSPISDSSGNSAKAVDINALFVLVDSNFSDVADQLNKVNVNQADTKAEFDKLILDVAAQKAELDKLIIDVGAVDSGSLVKSDATAATDTTGDVRGTYDPTMVLDGSKTLKITYKPQGRKSRTAYGVTQFRKAT